MLRPDRLQRLMIETIFMLLGGLFVWLAVTRHVFFDRSGAGWMVLSAALILWGLRGLYKPGQWWARWEIWTRGLSLVLLGVVMLVIARAPPLWVPPLLSLAGMILVARGAIGAGLVLKQK